MSAILVFSIVIRLAALGWSVRLFFRLRDWRLLFLSGMICLMAARQIWTLLKAPQLWPPSLSAHLDELPGLAVSVLALFAVVCMERMIRERDKRSAELESANRMFESEITERKRAEIALRKSKARLVEAQRVARLGNWDLDLMTGELCWSDEIFRMFAIERETFDGTTEIFYCRVHPDDRVLVREAVDAAINDRKPYILDHRIVLPNGEERIVHEQAEVEIDESGKPVFVRGTVQDITDRKRIEEELVDNRRIMREVFDNLPAAINLMDSNGCYVLVNKTLADCYGLTPEEAMRSWTFEEYDLDPDPYRNKESSEERFLVLAGGEPMPFKEYEFQIEGRTEIWLGTRIPIKDSSEEVKYVLTIALDVTERKALETQLLETQKLQAVGTLAGGIAHDFNNILAGMTGYAHLALDAAPAEGQLRDDLGQVMVGIDRATSLVRQILAFSRRGGTARHPVAVGPVVEEALRLIRASIPAMIEVRRKIEGDAGTVVADSTQLQQVVMNLCTNARDAIGDNPGEIEVGLAAVELSSADAASHPPLTAGPYVKLSVRDNGSGMDEATEERALEPFFTTKPPDKGTGLGLSVVHGIVGAHGGAIDIASAPGRGTTVSVFLPRVDEVEIVASPASEKVPGGSGRILLVDDEAAIVRSQKRLLERLGYDVETATSGVGALEAFRAAPDSFDLIITDQAMPEMSGAVLAREVLKVRGDMPIILCSGLAQGLGEEDSAAIGVREIMTKPIDPRDLARTVRRALDRDR